VLTAGCWNLHYLYATLTAFSKNKNAGNKKVLKDKMQLI